MSTTAVMQTIRERRSVRTFQPLLLRPEHLEAVNARIDGNFVGPFANSIRFALIERKRAQRQQRVRLGTYGVIKGAPYFVAGGMKRSATAELDFGYVMEKIVLQLTALGLGTCWIGGFLKRAEYAQLLGLEADEFVPGITPLGYTSTASLRERVVRWSAKADKRRPFASRFFEGDVHHPLSKDMAGTYAEPLEMVRLAPSAENNQPWRVIRRERAFHFYLKRSTLIGRLVPSADLQMIDMGIAMSHFELAAAELGLTGRWQQQAPEENLAGELEYVVSWCPEQPQNIPSSHGPKTVGLR